MLDSRPRPRRPPPPGLRALQRSGDGFWELDLLNGTAWFSEWFYTKFNWLTQARRTALTALEPMLNPGHWNFLLREIRVHLEQGTPLDVELCVRLHPGRLEYWQLRGSAERDGAGRPALLAGSMRDVSVTRRQRLDASFSLLSLRGAFDVLPVAGALLDDQDRIVETNRLWRGLTNEEGQHALARLAAVRAAAGAGITVDYHTAIAGDIKLMRLTTQRFPLNGLPGLVVMLEDRTHKPARPAR